jgi:SAM-dependent methyltransferase
MPAMDYAQVAHWYDTYVKTDIDISFFLNETKNCTKVLELTSGTGRLSIPLIEAGVFLTCVDNSPEMLAILRQKITEKGLSAQVYEMDMCNLSLQEQFDLIIIPFNSFAEILSLEEQCKALQGIRNCLTKTGRFICTLHNPFLRIKSVNGQLTLRGKHSLPNQEGTLFLWSIESKNQDDYLVRGTQFLEVYDSKGIMYQKSFIDIQFYLHQPEKFQELFQSQGFRLLNLYGDYLYSDFNQKNSPFIISIWTIATS